MPLPYPPNGHPSVEFNHRDWPCAMILNRNTQFSWWCGYTLLPAAHPLNDLHLSDFYILRPPVEITFKQDGWIGFSTDREAEAGAAIPRDDVIHMTRELANWLIAYRWQRPEISDLVKWMANANYSLVEFHLKQMEKADGCR